MSNRETKQVFEGYAAETSYCLENASAFNSDQCLALNTVCKRPEFRPLLTGIIFCIDKDPDMFFALDAPRKIRIGSGVLDCPASAAFHLRHALELSLLSYGLPEDNLEEKIVISSITAMHASVLYLNDMIVQERELVLGVLPGWLVDIFSRVTALESSHEYADAVRNIIRVYLEQLMQFQYKGYLDTINKKMAELKKLSRTIQLESMFAVSVPTERILASGGDTRLNVIPDTGLNKYGCSPRPRPWAITFSSCTSSSVSDYAFWSAEKLRQKLLPDAVNGLLHNRYQYELERIRQKLLLLMKLDRIPGTEIILTPSGTDAELYALHLAIGNSGQPLHNILISRTEVGSGTEYAAGGRHFDRCASLGLEMIPGTPVDGFPVGDIDVEVLELRGEYGVLPPAGELNGRMREQVEKALSRGKRVLVHLLDCSKTGIGGPGLDCVQQMKSDHPGDVEVLVDAAQFRLGRAAIHRYVESGFMVVLTGSKFFTGPPFSGALIVPPQISEKVAQMPVLPEGMLAYATKAELPSSWGGFARNLSEKQNLGLLLRWQSALWEINAFYSVSEQQRFYVMEMFGKRILEMISSNPDLGLVMAPLHDRGYQPSEQSWDQLPTIFTFLVKRTDRNSGEQHPLTYEEARYAYHCINTDIARFLPVSASDRDHELAAKRCHIGQPVKIQQDHNSWIGALRIAAGARLVSGVQYDSSLGDKPENRLLREIQTAGVIFGKLSVIVKYWDDLKRYDLTSGAHASASFYQF